MCTLVMAFHAVCAAPFSVAAGLGYECSRAEVEEWLTVPCRIERAAAHRGWASDAWFLELQ